MGTPSRLQRVETVPHRVQTPRRPTPLHPLPPLLANLLQVYPNIYNWTTYPITVLLERLWNTYRPNASVVVPINPFAVELCAVLERALNYAHTGHARVIATGLMNPLFVGMSLIDHGTVTFSNSVSLGERNGKCPTIIETLHPRRSRTKAPITCSQAAIKFAYSESMWLVSTYFPNPAVSGRKRFSLGMPPYRRFLTFAFRRILDASDLRSFPSSPIETWGAF